MCFCHVKNVSWGFIIQTSLCLLLVLMVCLQPKCTLHSTVIYPFTLWWQWQSCRMQPAHQDWKPFTHALTAHSGTAQHWGSEYGSKDSWTWTLQELRIKNTHLTTSRRPLYYQSHWKKAALVNLVPEEKKRKKKPWLTYCTFEKLWQQYSWLKQCFMYLNECAVFLNAL